MMKTIIISPYPVVFQKKKREEEEEEEMWFWHLERSKKSQTWKHLEIMGY